MIWVSSSQHSGSCCDNCFPTPGCTTAAVHNESFPADQQRAQSRRLCSKFRLLRACAWHAFAAVRKAERLMRLCCTPALLLGWQAGDTGKIMLLPAASWDLYPQRVTLRKIHDHAKGPSMSKDLQ